MRLDDWTQKRRHDWFVLIADDFPNYGGVHVEHLFFWLLTFVHLCHSRKVCFLIGSDNHKTVGSLIGTFPNPLPGCCPVVGAVPLPVLGGRALALPPVTRVGEPNTIGAFG